MSWAMTPGFSLLARTAGLTWAVAETGDGK